MQNKKAVSKRQCDLDCSTFMEESGRCVSASLDASRWISGKIIFSLFEKEFKRDRCIINLKCLKGDEQVKEKNI